MWSGSKNLGLLDHFTLVIPFCLDSIRWQVMYNAVYPLTAPDIIFGPEDESFYPYHGNNEKVTTNGLTDWRSKDPTRLVSLIMELRNEYMAYQRKRIEEADYGRLKFEISTILSRKVIFPVVKKFSTAPPPRLKLISSADLKALFSIDDFRLPP